MIPFVSWREAFEALVGGQADVAFMAEFPAATGILTGQPFSVIADLTRYEGMRIITKGAPLSAPGDLAGKRIGTSIGTNTDYYLSQVLASGDVQAEIVNAAASDLVVALARGDVDAITYYGPAAAALGGDYREWRAPGYRTHYILAVNSGIGDGKLAAMRTFLGALVRANADVAADPGAAMDATAAVMQGIVAREALDSLWADSSFDIRLGADLAELLHGEAEWILSKGVIQGDLPTVETVRSFIDPAPLAAIAPGAVKLD
ncbi:MAG: ABC transporter substrate-binding protein [Paracoccus sp. (in: a-proteobacteria)]